MTLQKNGLGWEVGGYQNISAFSSKSAGIITWHSTLFVSLILA